MSPKATDNELKLRIAALEKENEDCRRIIQSLQITKERYDALLNQSIDCIFVVDLEGRFLDGNPKALGLLGYGREQALSSKITDFLSKNQFLQFFSHIEDIIKSGVQKNIGEFSLKHRDGSIVYLETNAAAIYRDGKIHAIQGVARDVTRRKQMEEDLKQKWDALKNAPIGIYIAQDGKIVWVNQRFVRETGYDENKLIGMDAMDLVVPEDRALLRENIIRMLKGLTSHPYEFRAIYSGTHAEKWVRGEVASTVFNGRRAVLGYYSDIDRLIMQNITDSLTGLHNRRYILERAEQFVDSANRYGYPLSLILLDVDQFKHYNDTLGHIEGDRALARIGDVLKNATRKVDIAGRYGGEEFCVLLPNTSLAYGLEVAQRIRTAIEKETKPPCLARGLTVSLGLAEIEKQNTLTDLLQKADGKLYAAKAAGKNRVAY
jgi:diguanylate cyclase (GGDEF)-like protein/PAS domain S-box-containing protein